jgi:hypothetical protein
MSDVPYIDAKPRLGGDINPAVRSAHFQTNWYEALSLHRVLFPGLVFAIHLAIVQLAASMAFRFGAESTVYSRERRQFQLMSIVDGFWETIVIPLSRWNGLWYIWSSQRDFRHGNVNPLGRFAGADDAYWPLLPWVMGYGHTVSRLPQGVVGYLFANLCLLAALIVLYRLIEIDFGLAIARRSIWCIALFPTAFFLSAISTEAPFLLFASTCLLVARKDHWAIAGLAGFLAALTNAHGVFLIFPMLVLLLAQERSATRRRLLNIGFVMLPLLGPVIFVLRLHQSGYRWSTLLEIQHLQLVQGKSPWAAVQCAYNGCTRQMTYASNIHVPGIQLEWAHSLAKDPSWELITSPTWRQEVATSGAIGLVVTLGCLFLAGIGLFQLPFWMNAYVVPLLVSALVRLPGDGPFNAMTRFALLLFPLAIVLALHLEDRITRFIMGAISMTLLVFLTAQFANWYGVT